MYAAKWYGDRTEPSLTPKQTLKTWDQLLFHLTHNVNINQKTNGQ